jgi:hypothetical protein
MCLDHPIVIERAGRDAPVLVKTPLAPEDGIRDGWAWRAVVDPDLTGTAEFWSVNDAKQWVQGNLDVIDRQTDHNHGPDMTAYEAWAAEDAAQAERIRQTYRAPARPVNPRVAESNRIFRKPITAAERALAEQLAALPRERQSKIVALANDLRKQG